MKWLQRLIQFFQTGGKNAKTGAVIARDIKYATQLKRIASWEHTNPEMFEWWKTQPPREKLKHLKAIKQGKSTPEQLETWWKSQLNMLPKTKQMQVVKGIRFNETEVDELKRIAKSLSKSLDKPPKQPIVITSNKFETASPYGMVNPNRISKTGQKYTKFEKFYAPKSPWESGQEVKIYLLTYEQALKIRPTLSRSTGGWADSYKHTVYIVWDNTNFRSFGHSADAAEANLKNVITHEVAHLKDPALHRAPKARTKYNSSAQYISDPAVALAKNSPENWLKNYYFHQWETLANTAPMLTSITDATSTVVKKIGKKRTIAALAELQQWAATGTGPVKNLSSDSRKILGYTNWFQKMFKSVPELPSQYHLQPAEEQITGLFDSFKRYPKEYKKLVNKLAVQLEDLKKQVKQTRNLTPESVIKYKVLI